MNAATVQFRRSFKWSRPAWAALLVAGASALGSGTALASPKGDAIDAMARYQQERSNCLSGQTDEDRATCLREAGAAFAQAKRGDLDDSETRAEYRRNALQRCDPLIGEDRLACKARVEGMGTTSGSVGGGGILRELRIEEVGPTVYVPQSEVQP